MNKKLISIAASAILGYIVGRNQEKITSWIKDRLGVVSPSKSMNDEGKKMLEEISEKYRRQSKDDERPEANEVDRDKIKEKLRINWEQTTNYASMYKPNNRVVDVDEASGNAATNEIIEFHELHKNDPPEWIDNNDVALVPGFIEREILLYFTYDFTLTDEDGNIIEDPSDLLGDLLDDTGFADSLEEYLYVLNYQADKLYVIRKENCAFG